MTYFVDTSGWYALLDRSDLSHARATEILERGEELVLTDHVLLETHRLAEFRLGRGVADRFWSAVEAGQMTLEPVTIGDLSAAHEVRMVWSDQDFSLVDCTSFVVMERLRLADVVTFDDDFAIYRHGNRRHRSFNVVR